MTDRASLRSRALLVGALGVAALVVGTYLVSPSASPAPAEDSIFADGTLSVSALLSGEDYWEATVIVRGPGGEFRFYSEGIGVHSQSRVEFLHSIRAGIGWKDGIFFVPASCGGGNAWRCNRVRLYRLFDGRLVELGEVYAGYEKPLGWMIRDGFVHDLFITLEANPFSSHAEAPSFDILLRADGARLVVDRDATWKSVEPQYREGTRKIEDCLKNEAERLNCGIPSVSEDPDYPYNELELAEFHLQLLWTAVLARYCGREAELATTMKKIAPLVDDPTRATIEREVQRVIPGAKMEW